MARKVRSLRGEEVDFDLLKTKQELGDKESVLEVRDREDFVHTKRRTRGRSALLQKLNKNKDAREPSTKKVNTSPSKTETTAETKTSATPKKRRIVKKD